MQGHCSVCDNIYKTTRNDAFKRHCLGCKGQKEAPNLRCNLCKQVFTRPQYFDKHYCKRNPPSDAATRYKYRLKSGSTAHVLNTLDSLNQYNYW